FQRGAGHGGDAGCDGRRGQRGKLAGVQRRQGDAAFLAGGEGGGVHGPEGEHADRDLVAVQAVGAEVLAGHDRRGGGDVGGAQSAGEDGGQAVAQRRVVVERGGVFVDLDLGGLVGGQAVGLGDAGGHAADRGQD